MLMWAKGNVNNIVSNIKVDCMSSKLNKIWILNKTGLPFKFATRAAVVQIGT
jgi:hypothetical protein